MTSLNLFHLFSDSVCNVRLKYHTDQKKDDCNSEEDSVSELLKLIFHLYQPCPLTPGGTFLPAGWVVLWVWCRDCRKAQEMNVLSAHAKKTRLQWERRNKYLNLTHLLLPSQTKQAADSFLSSNKTHFSLAWWRLPLLSHFHIWYLEGEHSACLVGTVWLDLWCLLSCAPLRLCSTRAEQHILLTQWKTECGRRWRSASVGRVQRPVQQQNLEREIAAGLWFSASQSNMHHYFSSEELWRKRSAPQSR